ncbi:MAG: hypothetical protein Q9219_000707 [cf. Caloplaca sp. 3 TL-2023]
MPQTSNRVEQVFAAIEEREKNNGIPLLDGVRDFIWIRAEIAKAKARYPLMRDLTLSNYIEYRSLAVARKLPPALSDKTPTSTDFWKAAYNFNPLGPNAPPHGSDLQRIIASGRAGPYTIGKLYGETTLKLIPAIGCLLAHEITGAEPTFEYAATDSGAISYPDGHPSTKMLQPRYPTPPFTGGRAKTTIQARDDDKLRRFAAIGWVIMQGPGGAWKKTGHVLVIDMDDRDVRHRQPWLVLAPQWPTDGQETADGDFNYYAEDDVDRDDSLEPGVFPGDNNRTPICRIDPMDPAQRGRLVLQLLGENFNFQPLRVEGHWRSKTSTKGPALARVMDWYWDPVAEQEVSYTKQGLEYMRYDRRTKEYSFPDFSKLSFVGEQGFFGELVGNATPGPVSLSQRLAQSGLSAEPSQAYRPRVHTTTGF